MNRDLSNYDGIVLPDGTPAVPPKPKSVNDEQLQALAMQCAQGLLSMPSMTELHGRLVDWQAANVKGGGEPLKIGQQDTLDVTKLLGETQDALVVMRQGAAERDNPSTPEVTD
jgi:hypothetical protein